MNFYLEIKILFKEVNYNNILLKYYAVKNYLFCDTYSDGTCCWKKETCS